MKTPPLNPMMSYPSLAPFENSVGKPMTPEEINSLLSFSHSTTPPKELVSKIEMNPAKLVKNPANAMFMGVSQLPMMKFTPPRQMDSKKISASMMFPGMTMPPMMFPPMNPMMMPKLPPFNPSMVTPDAAPAKTVVLQCPFPECKLVWHKTKDLYKHLREYHKTDFTCPYCDKQSTCMSNFVCHVRLHTNEKPWICPVSDCEYKGRTKNHAKSHVIQNHGIKHFHKHEKFFLQDRCRKRHDSPFTIPRSLFKRSASQLASTFAMTNMANIAALKKFQMGPGNFLNNSFTPSPMSMSPPQLALPPKLKPGVGPI